MVWYSILQQVILSSHLLRYYRRNKYLFKLIRMTWAVILERVYILKFSIQLSLAHKSRRGFYGSQCSYFVYCGCFKYLWACSVTESVTGTTRTISVGIHLLEANNRNNRTRCEICSKLTIKTPEVSLLLTLSIFHTMFLCFCC